MAWNQKSLEQLEDTIGSGASEVRYNDRSVKYRPLDDLMRAREVMAKELGVTQKKRRVFPVFSRGFE